MSVMYNFVMFEMIVMAVKKGWTVGVRFMVRSICFTEGLSFKLCRLCM